MWITLAARLRVWSVESGWQRSTPAHVHCHACAHAQPLRLAQQAQHSVPARHPVAGRDRNEGETRELAEVGRICERNLGPERAQPLGRWPRVGLVIRPFNERCINPSIRKFLRDRGQRNDTLATLHGQTVEQRGHHKRSSKCSTVTGCRHEPCAGRLVNGGAH